MTTNTEPKPPASEPPEGGLWEKGLGFFIDSKLVVVLLVVDVADQGGQL